MFSMPAMAAGCNNDCVSCLNVYLSTWTCWTLLCLIAGGSHGRSDKNSGRFAGSSASGKLRGRAGELAGWRAGWQRRGCIGSGRSGAPMDETRLLRGAGGRVFAQTPRPCCSVACSNGSKTRAKRTGIKSSAAAGMYISYDAPSMYGWEHDE
jgi:hypothetical protein